MTAPPAARPDVRLEDEPMRAVGCPACGAVVTARKASWAQTSLQWDADSLARCEERAAHHGVTDRPNRAAFAGCSALADGVREAATKGRLAVRSNGPLPTHPTPTAPEDHR